MKVKFEGVMIQVGIDVLKSLSVPKQYLTCLMPELEEHAFSLVVIEVAGDEEELSVFWFDPNYPVRF
jgi:hypothetical protein